MSNKSDRNFLRDNGLSLCFGSLFLLALVGQALTGHAMHNNEAATEGLEQVSLLR